jgi:2-oxoglutaroyl-CoA hydrolase
MNQLYIGPMPGGRWLERELRKPRPLSRRGDCAISFEGIRLQVDERRLRADIILNQPTGNRLSQAQDAQLQVIFDCLSRDPAIRVIVIRSDSEHFSAGEVTADNLMQSYPARRISSVDAVARCGKLVIAANRGYCFGLAFELSLACDFRIVTETTIYAPNDNLVRIPSPATCARLMRIVGTARAKDIIIRSRCVSGAQAYEWGIATEFVANAELESATDAMVDELLSLPARAQSEASAILNALSERD